MLAQLKDTILGFIVCIAIVCIIWFVWSVKKPIQNEIQISTAKADSLDAMKPSIKYAKKIATIEAVTIFEIKTIDGNKLYLTVSNAPGVTAAVTVDTETLR